MSFYLAWSLTKLILTLLAILLSVSFVFYYNVRYKQEIPNKNIVYFGALLLFCTLVSAVNTGERQSTLGRSGFNSDTPVLLEKINPNTFNSEEVNKQFKSTIGDK